MNRLNSIGRFALAASFAWLIAGPSALSANPTVGIEGQLDLLIPGTLLKTLPTDPKEPVTVRIANTRLHGSQIQYDLRYIGQEPGTYDLKKYLAREDGTTMDGVPPVHVQVVGVLPPVHKGELNSPPAPAIPRLSGYRWWMIGAGALWVGLLIPLLRKRRSNAGDAITDESPAPVTMADRLRPLINDATKGTITADGKAQLDRLLLAYWSERLALNETDPVLALQKIREHPEAGALLRALEEWLYRPAGQAPADLDRYLAPYLAPSPATNEAIPSASTSPAA